jgi:4-carboxymuconolactone decarboxylase
VTELERSERYESGMKVRREVLGDAYVDSALAGATEITRMMQDLTTEMAWGTIWTRPGLPRKTRSLMNVAMLTALGKPNELRLHLRGALRNGCTQEEIAEALLQAAVYAGIPAGIEGFRMAKEVFAEE